MYLTNKLFLKQVNKINTPYWNEGKKYRWEYMSFAIELMKSVGAKNTIEMGTYYIPLNSDSFLIELDKKHIVTRKGIVHDLNKTPYPVPSKQFDCAVALQVWEHLDKQKEAFEELRRISKNIILSFPYKWKHGDSRHRGITKDKISDWTGHKKPDIIKLFNHGRIMYFWKNL